MTSRAAGFTLLEMIVAVAVLGLVMLGAAQGIRFGLDGWSRQSRHVQDTADIDGADRVLRTLFRSIDLARIGQIDGAPDHFTFVGRLPDVFPAEDRRAEMTLAVTSDRRLVVRWKPYRHAVDFVPPRVTETELLRDIDAIQFSYQRGAPAGSWQTTISGEVPSLIRVHIARGSRHRGFPDLIAAPVITNG